MSLAIAGLATAQPPRSITQAEACDHALPLVCQTDRQARILQEIYERTEIERRSIVLAECAHSGQLTMPFLARQIGGAENGPGTGERMLAYEREAGPLALRASRLALEDAGITAGQVTHLITVSCTGFFAPGFDISLIKELPLAPSVARAQIGFMGCHGVLNALRIAQSIAAAEANARILICAVELCSLHFQYEWTADNVVANSLFADGAGALVLANSDRVRANPWTATGFHSRVIPESEKLMTWRIGNHGFTMTLSPLVPNLVSQHLPAWIAGWLNESDLTPAEIESWAIHPGGPRILDAVAESLNLSERAMAPSRRLLSDCGNMSSPSVIFVLERLRAENAARPCVVLGFGPGISFEAALLV